MITPRAGPALLPHHRRVAPKPVTDRNDFADPLPGTRTGKLPRYVLPSEVISRVKTLRPGQWLTFQSYLLVTGTSPAYKHNTTRWDCRSSNPSLHWTNDNERYCYSDWKRIVNAIAALRNTTVTDPLTVGVALGRPSRY
jgi:hypothetical protein